MFLYLLYKTKFLFLDRFETPNKYKSFNHLRNLGRQNKDFRAPIFFLLLEIYLILSSTIYSI